ncbi:hypothetical protein LCGC14_1923250 [marine sediment metagenome]|uniref:Uncharacterized protein n=1 Tax=marine sediment metagenome TaxID=412755 RepID=A0A0F9FPX5_9ZZZZ
MRKRKIKNRIGEIHGLLTVVELINIKDETPRRSLWRCICTCGTQNYNVTSIWLSRKTKSTKSCGCFPKERNHFGKTLPKEIAALNKIYILYKSEAKKRNLNFNISKHIFEKLIFSNCHYCDSTLSNSSIVYRPKLGNFSTKYNGIDRKNNNKGYIESNCVPCCVTCNLAKRKLSYDDFIKHITKIYKHLIKI